MQLPLFGILECFGVGRAPLGARASCPQRLRRPATPRVISTPLGQPTCCGLEGRAPVAALARWILVALVGLICVFADRAQAQWVQQQIVLKPGWNAVFLEVDPTPEECDALFAGLPVESVWDFNRQSDSAQFIQDPTSLIPGAAGWLTWLPSTHPLASRANLFILRDGRPYLVKLADTAQSLTWTVTGKPSLRGITWQAGAVNFVGFHVTAAPSPSFANLFAGEGGLAGQPVYALDPVGVWRPFTDLTAARPLPGAGYWVRCQSPATRSATIAVDPGSREGLLFGRDAAEQSLRVRNTSAAARNITLRLLASAPPPAGQPPLAGAVALEYRDAKYAQAQFDWKPLTNTLSFASLLPGAEWNVRLGVRRSALPAAAVGHYQSLIEVTDDLGARWLIPVSAEAASTSAPAGPLQLSSGGATNAGAGLWIGEAVINAVSQPAHPGDPALTRPTGGDFSFRLILHVDGDGTARLLQHVFLVRKAPTFKPDPANPGFNIPDQPARTVVVTDEALIPQIIGSAGIIGRRISSAAFGFKSPVVLTGGGGTNTCAIALDYNHPLNPFKHIYHPDHNNLDERFEQTLPEGKESFTVTRSLSLEFTTEDPLGLNPPGWGDTEVGGTYRETITGLHRNTIHIAGNFRLVRVARVGTLNDAANAGLASTGQ